MRFNISLMVAPAVALVCAAAGAASGHAQSVATAAKPQIVHADLEYRAPREGVTVKPNFSPKGEQVKLTPVPAGAPLPAGAVRPAKTGVMKIGTDHSAWIPVLVTSSAAHPSDLTQVYLDRNRNGSFTDDGPPVVGEPAQNAKTKAWWMTINKIELSVPYPLLHSNQLYMVNFWIVRDDSLPAPDVMRYSVGSWRSGKVSINGVDAYVAAMDDNNAVFDKDDMWSVVGASEPKAASAVLSIAEAHDTNRLMFVPTADGKEMVLQFKRFTPDGSGIDFAVVNLPVTKKQDRLSDDIVKDERPRPRAPVPVTWLHGSTGLAAALADASKSGKKVLIDFEATWCGPCHTMDEWVWSDAEVASAISAGYVGVKIDVDLEKGLVSRFKTVGYPTMVVLDGAGNEVKRHMDYMGSAAILGFLR